MKLAVAETWVLAALAVFAALIHFQVSTWRQAAALLRDEE